VRRSACPGESTLAAGPVTDAELVCLAVVPPVKRSLIAYDHV
jgi:hypothetical protein